MAENATDWPQDEYILAHLATRYECVAELRAQLTAAQGRIAELEAERDLWKAALLEGLEEVKRASGQLEAYKHKFQDRLRKAEGQSE